MTNEEYVSKDNRDTKSDKMKPSNPKDIIGASKIPLHLWPLPATVYGSLALLDGALKYGRTNWRSDEVRASIYLDACARHLAFYMEGEDTDPDSSLPHLAHAIACIAIIIDAEANDKLNDDRILSTGKYREFFNELTPHVKRLKELYKDKNPRHFTIKDNLINK